ncbi:hypothetical protein [Acidocella sp.]|jgi:hypothetical protein|uniref:hypothetical protein n=1 Tax=Acidocella sp. TaxID=50710 RepID=UPI002F3E5B3C
MNTMATARFRTGQLLGEGRGRFSSQSGAKTFVMPGDGRGHRQRPWPKLIKFFCYFLFTKSSLPLLFRYPRFGYLKSSAANIGIEPDLARNRRD